MKQLHFFLYTLISLFFAGCATENDSTDDKYDNITINGIEHDLVLDNNETHYGWTGAGPFHFDNQTGITTTRYYTLYLVDPNHELGGDFTPNYIKNLDFRFIVKPELTSGIYTTTLNNTASINQNQVYTEAIIDNKNTIPADANQNITITITPQKIKFTFTNLTYGSNKISGSFSMPY